MSRAFTRASSHYLNSTTAPVTDNSFTISAWIRPSAVNVDQAVVSIGKSTANDRHLLYVTSANVASMFSGNAAFTSGAATKSAAFTAGAWGHIGGVVSAANARQVYVNGVAGAANTTNVTGITPDRFYTGAYYTNGALVAGYYFGGDIAEVGVWDEALTDAEFAALADRVSPVLVRPSALVGYWPIFGRSSPEEDIFGTNELTVTGAVQAEHPPMRYPGRVQAWKYGAAAPASIVGPLIGSGHLMGRGPLIGGRLAA